MVVDPEGTPSIGVVPAGEYLFDFRAANVSVKGQTFVEWFVEEYGLGASGYYIDDAWAGDVKSNAHGPSECDKNWQVDTGMTKDEVTAEIAAFRWVADKVYAAMLTRGKFNWNQFLNNYPNCPTCGNCPGPWVRRATCARDLRRWCNASAAVHTRAMYVLLMLPPPPPLLLLSSLTFSRCRHYGIRGCGARSPSGTQNLSDVGPAVANFLLLRGEFAYLSTGWSGCSLLQKAHDYGWSRQWFDEDYGQPINEICAETAAGSGVFERQWSNGMISMDCKSWTPLWKPHQPLKIKADDDPCTLKSSSPVVATQHGQLISNLRIATAAQGVAAITVHAFENVTIQNVQIQHGAHGGSGIAFSAAHGLTIRNASIALVDASVPTGGPLPTSDAVRASHLLPLAFSFLR